MQASTEIECIAKDISEPYIGLKSLIKALKADDFPELKSEENRNAHSHLIKMLEKIPDPDDKGDHESIITLVNNKRPPIEIRYVWRHNKFFVRFDDLFGIVNDINVTYDQFCASDPMFFMTEFACDIKDALGFMYARLNQIRHEINVALKEKPGIEY